jgi:hypothetical protein
MHVGRLVSNKNKLVEAKLIKAPASDYAKNRLEKRGPAFNDKVLSGLQAKPQVLPELCFHWSDAVGDFIEDDMSLGWGELLKFAPTGLVSPTAGWDVVKAHVKRELPRPPPLSSSPSLPLYP